MIKVNGYESEINGMGGELIKEAVVALNHVIEEVSEGDAEDATEIMCRIVKITCSLLRKEGIDIDRAMIIKVLHD